MHDVRLCVPICVRGGEDGREREYGWRGKSREVMSRIES